MVKKKSASGISKAEAIRESLRAIGISAPTKEVVANVKKNHSHIKFNPKTASVDVSIQRRKLRGGSIKAHAVKRVRPSSDAFDVHQLKAAQQFVAQIGDAEAAINAIRQLQALQIH